MKRLFCAIFATFLSLGALSSSPALAREEAPAPIASVWRNPGNSVHVRIDQCGERLCGTVTWASPKAIADARRGGTDRLVGTRLFRDLERTDDGKWRGKVFVPDIRQTFSGTLRFVGSDRMEGKGCVLLGLICKSQTWSRVR